MSYGVRIRHNKARNCVWPVPLPHKPLLNNKTECGYCLRERGVNVIHPCKVVHVRLDAEGCTIVSRPIWDDFCKVYNNAGFMPANLVFDPPAQTATPPTVKVELDGVTFGVKQAKRQHSVGSGKMLRPTARPDTMTVDEYVDKCARMGIGRSQALNALLVAYLRPGRNP